MAERTEETIEVYTAITGGYEKPRDDVKVFTDYGKFVGHVMNAKIYKILSHQFIDADISVWMDGNIQLLVGKQDLVKEFLGDADIALFRHPDRDCIYEEAEAAKGLFKESNSDVVMDITRQMNHYKARGIPEHIGLAECGMMIRRHNDKIKRFNEKWWSEICRWSQRDQLSFPICTEGLKINYINGNVRNHPYFKYEPRTISR